MSETGTVEIADDSGAPTKITVGIVTIAEGCAQGQAPGVYFTFPKANPQPSDTIALHGPHESTEAALEAAGTFLIDAAEAEALETLEIAA